MTTQQRHAAFTADLAERLCGHVDWARPDLPGTDAARHHEAGRPREAAVALAAHLRRRPTPRLGYTAEHVRRARAAATDAQRRDAALRIERVLAVDRLISHRNVGLLTITPEQLHIGLTRAHADRHTALLAEHRPGRDPLCWGVTGNICRLLQAAWPLETFPDDAVAACLLWLCEQAHAEWQWARTWDEAKLGCEGHNWWLYTFGGLWTTALFFPELRGVGKFHTLAPTWLEREARLSLKPDGFCCEYSGYHYAVVAMLIEYADIAQLNGIELSETYRQRVRAAAELPWKLIAPDGAMPHLGDGYRKYGRGDSMAQYLRPYAGAFDLGESKYVAERLAPSLEPGESIRLQRHDVTDAYHALTPHAPDGPDQRLPESGFYVIRRDWTPDADWACIDAAAHGHRGSGHKHIDLLGMTLYARGRPVLLDNGKGPVGSGAPRTWRIQSAAHNVPTVDGEDHIRLVSDFRRERQVVPVVNDWISEPCYAYFNGVHEGYARLDPPVVATRRKLFYLRGRYWILIDRFTPHDPADEHTYEQHFHLAAPVMLEDGGRVRTRGEGGNLLIVPVLPEPPRATVEPNPHPLEGYDNPDHLCYRWRGRGRPLFVHVMVPFTGAQQPDVRIERLPVETDDGVLDPWEATALRIVVHGREDVYVDQHMHWNLPWRVAGYASAQRLFHSQCHRPLEAASPAAP